MSQRAFLEAKRHKEGGCRAWLRCMLEVLAPETGPGLGNVGHSDIDKSDRCHDFVVAEE